MDNVERLGKEVMAWAEKRNAKEAKVDWRFTTGDARIKAACRSAGIPKIHHIDVQVKSILGFSATYTIIVYGE